jgi:hypothetical protein
MKGFHVNKNGLVEAFRYMQPWNHDYGMVS